MYEHKILKPLTKQNILMTNGIFKVDRDKKHFIQYNDYFEHATFFQCPKCKSLNNETGKAYENSVSVIIVRSCEDCGYKHITELHKEDDE